MRLTSKGQLTIPQPIRQRLGLVRNTEVVFDVIGDSVRIRKAPTPKRSRAVVAHLRGRATARLTTDEILALTRG